MDMNLRLSRHAMMKEPARKVRLNRGSDRNHDLMSPTGSSIVFSNEIIRVTRLEDAHKHSDRATCVIVLMTCKFITEVVDRAVPHQAVRIKSFCSVKGWCTRSSGNARINR